MNSFTGFRTLAGLILFSCIVLAPQEAKAQCAVSYKDAYEDGTNVSAWDSVSDSYNQSPCYPGWWDFTHTYYTYVGIQSPSGRTAGGSGQSTAWGGGGYDESWASLAISDEFGTYIASTAEQIVCSIVGTIFAASSAQNVPATRFTCPSSVTRGDSMTATLTAPGASNQSWSFSGGGGSASKSGDNTWAGTMVVSGTITVQFTIGGVPRTQVCTVTTNPRAWHTNPASAQEVSNGTHITLATPPVAFSDTGYFEEQAGNSGFTVSTVSGGPNSGFLYHTTQLSMSPFYAEYEINPDLGNSNSTFFQRQCGNYNAQNNPGGFISGQNLLTQTPRHEYNSSTQSHYAFYANALNTNNPGDYFEARTAAPGANGQQFASTTPDALISLYNQIGSATATEPYGVNSNENGTFLGNVNFPPYVTCP